MNENMNYHQFVQDVANAVAAQMKMNFDNFTEDTYSTPDIKADMAKYKKRVPAGRNPDGSTAYHWIRADSQAELNRKIAAFYAENNLLNEAAEESTPVFKDYAEEWLKLYKDGKVKKNTTATYRKNLNAHLYPAFGSMHLSEITTPKVQAFLNERSHMAEKTLKMLLALLGQIMKSAVEDELITKDPTASRRITIPSKKKKERQALPLTRFKQIMNGIHQLEPMGRRYMALLMLAGMRRGEALGMMWEDIDLEEGMLHIRRGVTHPQQNQPNIESLPKTKSGVREIPLDPLLIDFLSPLGKEGFIIGGDSPISLRSFNNMWRRINKTIDLTDVTSHIFRHSYLTYAAGETTDLKTLQALAGHSTIQMTMDHYVHARPEKLKELGDRMHNLFVQ